ncbi:MAG: hypothetical protein COA39_012395 [Sulfurimonas sp.]|nr:hypothetical protein [Sulfurimonas sp.]
MTQEQIKELFGVAPATLKDWKNNPKNRKHNLGKYLVSLDYNNTKKDLKKLDLIDDNRL